MFPDLSVSGGKVEDDRVLSSCLCQYIQLHITCILQSCRSVQTYKAFFRNLLEELLCIFRSDFVHFFLVILVLDLYGVNDYGKNGEKIQLSKDFTET